MLRGRLFLHVDARVDMLIIQVQSTPACTIYIQRSMLERPRGDHWRFSGPTWAFSPLGPGNQAATVPVTTANGIHRCYTQSASITWPIAILRSGPDGRYGPPKSNEEVKEKEKKEEGDDDEEEEKAKVKEVEDEFTEIFKMALRITASRSSRRQIARQTGNYPLQTTSSVKHSLRRNRVAIPQLTNPLGVHSQGLLPCLSSLKAPVPT
ncbi:hypothetical protein GB937_001499 [Aspergillus fischeri]|nr:hypothetical protein GB937_001499 [Aspergillus fischeri]